jgi:hypothetical protein
MAECSESFVQQECRLATFPFEVAFVYDQLFGIHTQGGPAILIRLLTRLRAGAARYFLTQCTNMGGKYNQIATHLPNDHEICQVDAIHIYYKCPQNIPNFSIPRPSKIYPNRDFLFENVPSGNPVAN